MPVNKIYVGDSVQTAFDRLVDQINIALRRMPQPDLRDIERKLHQLQQEVEKARNRALPAPPALDLAVPDPTAVELVSVAATGAVARITLRYRPPESDEFVGVAVFGRWLDPQSGQPVGAMWQTGGGDVIPYSYNGAQWSDVTVEVSQPADDDTSIRLWVCGRSITTTNTPGTSTPYIDVVVAKQTLLVVGAPVAPTAVTAYRSNYDSQTYIVTTEWTMPPQIGGTTDVVVQMRFYSDENASTPTSDWITLGGADVNDVRLYSGPFPKPVAPAWAKTRAAGLNPLKDASAWVESAVIDIPAADNPIWELPAPQAGVTGVTAAPQYRDDGSYGILTQWTPPSPLGSTVKYEVQARFWRDAGLTQPDSDWITLGEAYPPAAELLSGWWPRAPYDTWFKVRVRPLNANNAAGAWTESATAPKLDKLPPPSQPAYCSVTALPTSDTHYSLRVHYSPVQPYAVSYQLYLQFYTDEQLTQPDGDPRLILTTTNTAIVDPYLYPFEVLGPYPRNTDARWVKAGVAAVNAVGGASEIRWSPLAARIDPVLTPPAAVGVSLALNEAVDGGVEVFGYTITVTKPADPGTTDGYEAEARFWLDSNLTQPDSDWIPLGWIDPATPTLVTDRWPKASYPAWTRVRVRAINLWGVGSEWVESNVVAIPAGALNLNEARAATIGAGLQVSAGKLATKVDGGTLAHDGNGNLTIAANRDLPFVTATPPSTTYLGANTVIYNGHLYTWRGTLYIPDSDAAWVKQQLQSNGLTGAEFSSLIAPVYIVTSAPGHYVGDVIYNSTEGRLYRWYGASYKPVMTGGEIKQELSVDQLTANQIAANAIVAGKVAAGAISTEQLSGNQIIVRPGWIAPPRLIVQNAGGATIGAIGDYDNGAFVGIWAVRARFGGTYSSPVIDLSDTGATINNASININGSGGTVQITPTTGLTVGMQGTGSNLQADYFGFKITTGASELHARGSVFEMRYGGVVKISLDSFGIATIGSSTGNRILLYSSGTPYVDVIGASGYVNASNYKVGGTVVVDSSRNVAANQVDAASWIRSSEYRFGYIGSESIFLGGITITQWIPAYNSAGTFIGKIPLIPV